MWMRKYFAQLNSTPTADDSWVMCDATAPDIDQYTPIIVLRDPMKRWISNCPATGTIVEIANNKFQSDYIFRNLEEWLWDEHSAKQIDFIRWLDLSKAVFFYCDKHLSKNVEHYFASQGFKNVAAPDITNQQSDDDVTKASADAWRKLFLIPEYANAFKRTYAKDYDLINSVKFYRQGESGDR